MKFENFVFQETSTDTYIRWPGIEPLAHAYTTYMSGNLAFVINGLEIKI